MNKADKKYIKGQKRITNIGGLSYLVAFIIALYLKLYVGALIVGVGGTLIYFLIWRRRDKKLESRLSNN